MTKKNEIIVTTLENNPELLTTVDLKLSKNDLIDLVTDEIRTELDDRIEQAREEHKNLEAELNEFVKSAGTAIHKKTLATISKLSPDLQVTYSYYLRCDNNDIENLSLYYQLSVLSSNKDSKSSLNIHYLNMSLYESQLPDKLIEKHKEAIEAQNLLDSLINEKHKFDYKAKNIRTQINRIILNGSKAGKNILDNLNRVKELVRKSLLQLNK